MEVVNHSLGTKAYLQFKEDDLFGQGSRRRVVGAVHHGGQLAWLLRGAWDKHLQAAEVLSRLPASGPEDTGEEVVKDKNLARLSRWNQVKVLSSH